MKRYKKNEREEAKFYICTSKYELFEMCVDTKSPEH